MSWHTGLSEAACSSFVLSCRSFQADEGLSASLGEEFSSAYLKLKYGQWNEYSRHLTQWELDTTLDC